MPPTIIPGAKIFIQQKRFKYLRKVKFICWVLIISGHFFLFSPTHARIANTDSDTLHPTPQEKIEAYLEFKRQYEDKDFELKRRGITRTRTRNGTIAVSDIAIYHIEYGRMADHRVAYSRDCKRILQNPLRRKSADSPECAKPFYVERYADTGLDPTTSCFQPQQHSPPVALIFETLADKELEHMVLINEFHSGEVDIQFSFEKATDEEFMQKVCAKLQAADERRDQNTPPSQMTPIIPAEHLRVSISYIDDDKNGEPEYVLLPYCINGSYFDQDPDNDAIQVGLKYPLITRADLADKTLSERPEYQKRLGLWKWKRPSEILISFCSNPGPDIIFYDLGKVVNGTVIDPEPDGEFDKFQFLY